MFMNMCFAFLILIDTWFFLFKYTLYLIDVEEMTISNRSLNFFNFFDKRGSFMIDKNKFVLQASMLLLQNRCSCSSETHVRFEEDGVKGLFVLEVNDGHSYLFHPIIIK